MKKLDDLIEDLRPLKVDNGCDQYAESIVPRQFKLRLMETLKEIQTELAYRAKCTPIKQHHKQSARLAVELGIPLTIKKWCLKGFDIDATPNDLPTLTATYVFYEEDEK